MSARMKMRHTEVRISLGNDSYLFKDVPKTRLQSLISSLDKYREDAIPWRDLARARINAQGGESGYMLRVAREKAKLTQTELAQILKMPQGNVSQIETGRRSVGKMLAKKLGGVFNLDYRVFL